MPLMPPPLPGTARRYAPSCRLRYPGPRRGTRSSATLQRVQGDGHAGGDAEVQPRIGHGDGVAVTDGDLLLAGHHQGAGGDVDEVEVEEERDPHLADVGDKVP